MKTRTLPGTGLTVSEVCLGTMTWGQQNNESQAHEQLDCAIAHGINFIDTAEMYPVPPRAETQGRTERFIGNWLAARPPGRAAIWSSPPRSPALAGGTGFAAGAPISPARQLPRVCR